MLIRAISVFRAIALFISQILGGMMASVLVRYLFPENFNVRTTLGGGTSIAQGIFIEALLTAELVFTIYMLAAEKHRATFMAPIGIGLALFIAELVGVQFTGGSLNPARSFGPCVVTANFDSEHWIYWLGPFIGALIAFMFYRFIKALEYEVRWHSILQSKPRVYDADEDALLDGQPWRRRRSAQRSHQEPGEGS